MSRPAYCMDAKAYCHDEESTGNRNDSSSDRGAFLKLKFAATKRLLEWQRTKLGNVSDMISAQIDSKESTTGAVRSLEDVVVECVSEKQKARRAIKRSQQASTGIKLLLQQADRYLERVASNSTPHAYETTLTVTAINVTEAEAATISQLIAAEKLFFVATATQLPRNNVVKQPQQSDSGYEEFFAKYLEQSDISYEEFVTKKSDTSYEEFVTNKSDTSYEEFVTNKSDTSYEEFVTNKSDTSHEEFVTNKSDTSYEEFVTKKSDTSYEEFVTKYLQQSDTSHEEFVTKYLQQSDMSDMDDVEDAVSSSEWKAFYAQMQCNVHST